MADDFDALISALEENSPVPASRRDTSNVGRPASAPTPSAPKVSGGISSVTADILAVRRLIAEFRGAGLDDVADELDAELKLFVRSMGRADAPGSFRNRLLTLARVVSFSYRPFISSASAERWVLMADDCGPFAACVAAALSPTIPDAMICPRPDSLVPSDDTDVDSISCGPFAASAVVLEEAPVPSVDRRERTALSPGVDPVHVGQMESPPTVDTAALASGISGQERLSAQSIGMASEIAVDRLAAVRSVDVASQETVVVVIKIGWCPDLGGHGAAVVSVHEAVGAGFGYLAGGMPVLRADATGLVQEATLRIADERVSVKEALLVAVDAALSAVVQISKICEAVPACMELMGLLIKVLQIVLRPAVCGAVVDRYIIALAVLASMAVEIADPGSDPPLLSDLVASGFDPLKLSCC